MNRLKAAWLLCLIFGLPILASGLVAPYLQVPSTLTRTGPPSTVVFTPKNPEWTEVFQLPSVQAPATIHLMATKSGPGNVTIQIASTSSVSLPEAFTLELTNQVPAVNTNLVLDYSVPYVFFVTSFNASYHLTVTGSWASLTYLQTNTYLGGVILLIGMVLFYFNRLVEEKEAAYRNALEAATSASSGRPRVSSVHCSVTSL